MRFIEISLVSLRESESRRFLEKATECAFKPLSKDSIEDLRMQSYQRRDEPPWTF
jgi:hypothetical protein